MPSVKDPSAVNTAFRPAAIDGVIVLTRISVNAFGVTKKCAAPTIFPATIVSVTFPGVSVFIRLLPISIVATFGSDEEALLPTGSFRVVPSVNRPSTTNLVVLPAATEVSFSRRRISVISAGVIVNLVVPWILKDVAVIVTVCEISAPFDIAFANPSLSIARIVGSDEIHFKASVSGLVVPSVKAPTAVKTCSFPAKIMGLTGITDIPVNCGGVTVSLAVPLMFPERAVMVTI